MTYAEPQVVTGTQQVAAFGQLLCSPSSSMTTTAGQTVTIYARSQGQTSFHVAATLTTGPGGTFSTTPTTISSDVWYYAVVDGRRSGVRRVRFAPTVTFTTSTPLTAASQIQTGKANAVTFTGTVSPQDKGAEVVLQRENSSSYEEWIPIQLGKVDPNGTSYTIKHTFVVPGDANLRVLVRPHGHFTARGISEELSFGISEPQNAALTINPSADPIPYGQPLTIEGKVAGAAPGTTVTLMSHPRGVPTLSTVQTTKTLDATGTYRFTIAQALSNTVYKVTSGAVSSAQLFEGVKYIVTATESTNKIPAFNTVTFSGTVTPARKNKRVYLEREIAPGGAFVVVDSGEVQENGTYSFTHLVFGAGKQIYRIKVAGDPENQTIGSGPLTVEVTPALPGPHFKLTKPAKLPSEGKL